jgi:hypothetical protein
VIASDRDRRALCAELGALAELARRAEQPDTAVQDVQLVAQVCGPASYHAWKVTREKAWGKQGGQYTTASWPDALDPLAYAVLLLPLPAGRVGLAAGKHPKPVATPIFTSGKPVTGGTYDDLVLGLVARWACNPGEWASARLAPPVVELMHRQGVYQRRLAAFEQDWPLPAPDGL